MHKKYTSPLAKSSPIQNTVDDPVEGVGVWQEITEIERDARALGSSELLRWAEELKDAELRILCGEPVPAPELLALQERMAGFLPQDGPAVAEVRCAEARR